jgi:hypothetical protein
MPYPVHQADINFLEWSSRLAVRDEVVAVLVDTADVAGGETASPTAGLGGNRNAHGAVRSSVRELLLLFGLLVHAPQIRPSPDCAVSRGTRWCTV